MPDSRSVWRTGRHLAGVWYSLTDAQMTVISTPCWCSRSPAVMSAGPLPFRPARWSPAPSPPLRPPVAVKVPLPFLLRRVALPVGFLSWRTTFKPGDVHGQREAAAAATGLEELADRRLDHGEAPTLEDPPDPRRYDRHHDVRCRPPPSWRRTTGPRRSSEPQRLGHEVGDDGPAVAVPPDRGADGVAVVERAERQIDVVEPLVDQLDRAHRAARRAPRGPTRRRRRSRGR